MFRHDRTVNVDTISVPTKASEESRSLVFNYDLVFLLISDRRFVSSNQLERKMGGQIPRARQRHRLSVYGESRPASERVSGELDVILFLIDIE